jgi:hypothetical protein
MAKKAQKLASSWTSIVVGGTVAIVALVGCTAGGDNQSSLATDAPESTSASVVSSSPVGPGTAPTSTSPGVTSPLKAGPVPGSCHARGSGLYVLPDPACTPGVSNPDVTQANLAQTICRRGWTATARPPESYTEPLKYHQMAAYGDTGSAARYEEDHLIPLELGGSPSSPENLWPEPGPSPNPKDRVENAANRAVCDGQMALVTAQRAIAADWMTLGQQLHVVGAETATVSGM